MIRASQVMPAVVEEVVRKAPLTPEKVSFVWRVSVGAAIGKATAVRLGEDGLLRVKCDSAAWATAVRKSAPLIQGRLDAMLGPGVVRALQFDS